MAKLVQYDVVDAFAWGLNRQWVQGNASVRRTAAPLGLHGEHSQRIHKWLHYATDDIDVTGSSLNAFCDNIGRKPTSDSRPLLVFLFVHVTFGARVSKEKLIKPISPDGSYDCS